MQDSHEASDITFSFMLTVVDAYILVTLYVVKQTTLISNTFQVEIVN
jgi:hypothetical protein